MDMTPGLYSVNALATELGIDRRTLAKRLALVPPTEVRGRVKRWRLRDALDAIELRPRKTSARGSDVDSQLLEALVLPTEDVLPWLATDLVPLDEYARELGVETAELAATAYYGFPLVAPARGQKLARVSRKHAELWRTLFGIFIETAGGDGSSLYLSREARKIRGLALE